MKLGFRPDRRRILAGLGVLTGAGMTASWSGALAAASGAALDEEFTGQGAAGTFVHLDTATDRTLYVGEARAAKRFIPASTFKIPNTLIALETGAIAGMDDVIAWNGKPQPVKDWERDLTVAEALKVSAVPVYQEIARRIGIGRYEDWLDRLGYGNAAVGRNVDTFWLEGPLSISAYEQAGFMAALALEELPAVSAASQRAVKQALPRQERDGRALVTKTGWCQATSPQVGWWVGWVESVDAQGKRRIDSFALNMNLASDEDLAKRARIGEAILRRLDL